MEPISGEANFTGQYNNLGTTEDGPKRRSFAINYKELLLKRVPVLQWLPKYSFNFFLSDLLAGFTVSLTEIPQGIAYAKVAGLPAEYGLYSGIMGCFMYFIFGGTKDINIGPTAIMALMVQPHVSDLGQDMAVLLCFLSGCIIFALGLLQLGFITEFFSYPIIAGFTCAAALNIASSQLNSLMGISKKANEFLEAWEHFFTYAGQTQIWDVTLGVLTMVFLFCTKEIRRFGTLKYRQDWSYSRNIAGRAIFLLSIGRNALAVIFGCFLAYGLEQRNGQIPFQITGTVNGGLPPFKLPPFSTNFKDKSYTFQDMVSNYGGIIAFCPLIAILEHIAIAKAFTKGSTLYATQEMIALGISNIMSSFVSSMPITGSFTRTAVNNASGVKTTLGGCVSAIIVLLALGFLTTAFKYIPKATLAAVVIVAMFYLFEFEAFSVLYKAKKLDLLLFIGTLLCCLFISLEYGILIGVGVNVTFVLYSNARPKIDVTFEEVSNGKVCVIKPRTGLHYTASEHLRELVVKQCLICDCSIVINGSAMGNIDSTIAKTFSELVDDMKVRKRSIFLWNFKQRIVGICVGYNQSLSEYFRDGSLSDFVVDNPEQVEISLP